MKRQINVRLSDEARGILGALSSKQSVSQAAILELLLRKEGRKLEASRGK